VSRRLLVINVALGIVSVVLAVGIVRTVLAKRPLPPPSASRPASAPAPAEAAAARNVGPGEYGIIAGLNLFNPSRTETTAVVAAAAPPVAKPILYGVVVDGAKSRAFLEDPVFKRVAGYSVGDTVGGGTIQTIAGDRVVIVRPEGPIEVRLQDPSKPRAAPVTTTAQAGPAHAQPAQAGPAQAQPAQVGPAQAQPAQVGPGVLPLTQNEPRRSLLRSQPGPGQIGAQPNPEQPAIPQGGRSNPPRRLRDGDSE
jgi:hypothetical protein